jgi:hypothetical protein
MRVTVSTTSGTPVRIAARMPEGPLVVAGHTPASVDRGTVLTDDTDLPHR